MKGIIKNKRGDIPVTVLVIGVFAICTLAIISFSLASIKSTKGFKESIQAVEEMNSEIQKYSFYTNVGEVKLGEFLNVKEGKYLEITKRIEDEEIIRVRYLLP